MEIKKTEKENKIEILPKKLYWISTSKPLINIKNGFYFKIDDIIKYNSLNTEFGPLDFGQIFIFIRKLDEILKNPKNKTKIIFLLTSEKNPQSKINSALLIGAFAIFILNKTYFFLIKKFSKVKPKFISYTNYIKKQNKHFSNLFDCFKALYYSKIMKIVNLQNFDISEYFILKNFKKGYITNIIPKKIYISSSPISKFFDTKNLSSPEEYIKILHLLQIKKIFRFNKKYYSKKIFEENGIKVIDYYTPPYEIPHPSIISKFLYKILKSKKKILIHCDFGLEISCGMLGLYIMQKWRMCAKSVIAFLKILRPGAIYGDFAGFLKKRQNRVFMICDFKEWNEEQKRISYELEEEEGSKKEIDVKKFIEMIKED